MSRIATFKIDIPQAALSDLSRRLAATRWPDEISSSGWDYGVSLDYMKEFCAYWQHDFDWRIQEKKLNELPHFSVDIRGSRLHYIYLKGQGKRSYPLLLTHGFPDSFIRYLKLARLLTTADLDGFSFDLIIPSIPGFGFSAPATARGMDASTIADIFMELMNVLGIPKFFAHGGDWGSSITEQLGLRHPEALLGIHLLDIPAKRIFAIKPNELTQEEKEFLERGQQWGKKEGAYGQIQATKPQTLAYGVNDSPAGLAAWILDLFRAWSDCDGRLENRFTKDELLVNIAIYWFTQTIHSSFRLYYETNQVPGPTPADKIAIPTAGAIFPKDIIPTPEAYARRFYNIQQWTQFSKGGHFAAMEEPALLAGDMRRFFKKLAN